MNGIGVFSLLAGALQLTIPSYALRLVRRFGAHRVGWFLVSAFSLLGLLHLLEPMKSGGSLGVSGRTLDIVYAVGSMLLLVGMAHVETLISERSVASRKEEELNHRLQRQAQERLEGLVEANQQLTQELASRAQNEEALRDSEAQYRLLFAQNPLAMWIVDLRSSRFLAVNKAALDQHGLTSDEFIERGIPGIVGPEAAARLLRDLARPCFGVECRGHWPFQARDGSILELELTVTDVKFCNCPARLVLARDVTAQRRDETELLTRSRVGSMAQLAGGVAHHLDNIFSTISTNTTALLEKESNPVYAAKLNQITTATQRGTGLSRQLLAAGSAQSATLEPLDLNALLQQHHPLLRRLTGHSIVLKKSLAANLPLALGDARMLENALVSLVLNARDAMPNGGTVTLGTKVVRLSEAEAGHRLHARAGEYVCFSVHDTGHGMKPEVQARVFEPFFTTKDAGKAMGLGLAAVFGQVRQQQGWLEYESRVSAGAEFKVFLPCAPREQNGSTAPRIAARERVLFIEPNDNLRALGRAALDRQGFIVSEADSAPLALTLWSSQAPKIDLLVTDIALPDGVSGLELAHELKKTKPGLHVVYTGAGGENREGLLEGFPYVAKPYTGDALLGALEGVLAG